MSFNSLLIHEVTIFNPASTSTDSRYGDEETIFDAGTLEMGRIDMRSSTENLNDRDTRVQSTMLFLKPTAAISSASYITWEGHEYRVDGEPLMKYDSAAPHHWEVELKEVLG